MHAGKSGLADAERKSQLLQFAILVPNTVQAIHRVIGNQQLYTAAPTFQYPCTMGVYNHSLADRCRTGA